MSRLFDKELERSANVIKHKLSELCTEYGEEDVADWARCTVHMMRKYRNIKEQKYHLPAPNWRLLCKELTGMMDDKLLQDQKDSNVTLWLVGNGKADGSLDDDTTKLLEICGHAIEAHHTGDHDAYQESIQDLKECVNDFAAEGGRMNQ